MLRTVSSIISNNSLLANFAFSHPGDAVLTKPVTWFLKPCAASNYLYSFWWTANFSAVGTGYGQEPTRPSSCHRLEVLSSSWRKATRRPSTSYSNSRTAGKGFIHNPRARQLWEVELRANFECLRTMLTVRFKLGLERRVRQIYCEVRDFACIPECWLNTSCHSIMLVMTVGSSSEMNMFLLCRSG